MKVTIELDERHIQMLSDEIGINIEYDSYEVEEDIEYAIKTLIELNEVQYDKRRKVKLF